MLDIEFTEFSDDGRVRDHNEDYLGHVLPATADDARARGWLFALADGVGGQELGEVASSTAVESMLAGFRACSEGESHVSLLTRLVQTANTRVYETGKGAAPGGVAMATTMVACALRYDRLAVAHVGDSRCYLIRRSQAVALTRDHTMANDQVLLGVLSKREAAESAACHVLSRSLGNDLFVTPDTSEHQLLAGDVLLLCSDGLHNSVKSSDMAEIVRESRDLKVAARKLINVANQRDGSDNISVQLVRVNGVERVGMYRGRPYRLR